MITRADQKKFLELTMSQFDFSRVAVVTTALEIMWGGSKKWHIPVESEIREFVRTLLDQDLSFLELVTYTRSGGFILSFQDGRFRLVYEVASLESHQTDLDEALKASPRP